MRSCAGELIVVIVVLVVDITCYNRCDTLTWCMHKKHLAIELTESWYEQLCRLASSQSGSENNRY
jgi:hypothetical protein